MNRLLACLCVGATLTLVHPVAAAAAPLRRFAIVVGANDGGGDRVVLRYATKDARSFATVLRELGGASAGDVEVLLDPDPAALDDLLARTHETLARARQRGRVELIVYYSGHSDESGLLLGGHRYGYERLRERLRAMPADVNIAILDSCASGAFTRSKGGVRRPAFTIDRANRVRGHAFLSSSSATEAAQESDSIAASFFTHYLVSGLRGGADRNRDGRVTLSEAYQFAFDATVTRTRKTRLGAQHPAYDMHLVGTGDVVMTDLRATSAALVLGEEVRGRLFIHDQAGNLVVELDKTPGSPVTLGLGPARYKLVLHDGARRLQRVVDLRTGAQVTVAAASFESFDGELTVARGDGPPGAEMAYREGVYPVAPLALQVVPSLGVANGDVEHRAALGIIGSGGAALRGVEVAGVFTLRSDWVRGAQVAGVGNWVGGRLRGVQVAGVGNWVERDARGGQIAGTGNWVGDSMRGVQVAGVGNWIGGPMRGIQVGGVGSWVDDSARGIQVAGAGNWVDGSMRGIQTAGAGNFAGGTVRGAQLAGAINVADEVTGLQIAGALNVARGESRVVQLAVVNVGGDVRGAQLGIVNIARDVDGMQLGVVNIARDSAAPVGLLNVIERGHKAAEVWTGDFAPLMVGAKLGGRVVYGLLAVGAHEDYLMAGGGLGVHLGRDRYWVDIDLASYTVADHELSETAADTVSQLRAMVGLPVLGELSVFGGVQLTGVFEGDEAADVPEISRVKGKVYEQDGVRARVSPGLLLGVSY